MSDVKQDTNDNFTASKSENEPEAQKEEGKENSGITEKAPGLITEEESEKTSRERAKSRRSSSKFVMAITRVSCKIRNLEN